MSCIRVLTALVVMTCVACWTDPFNWHFLPKHYRLDSTLTVNHTVPLDTDCGTLATDSGASHFLWDPESGLCSISSGLTAVDLTGSTEQGSKTSVYYVRDFALVVPPGSPNCPTKGQLEQMIDNLRSLNGSFAIESDPTRRTWRDECTKNDSDHATSATTTSPTLSPTSKASRTANMSSVTTPVTSTDTSSRRTSPSTVDIGLSKTDSSATSPPAATRPETAPGQTDAGPSTAAASTSWPTTNAIMNTPITHSATTPSNSPTAAATASRSTADIDSITTTPSITSLDMTTPDLPISATATTWPTADNHVPVSNAITHNRFTTTIGETTTFKDTDATMEEETITTAFKTTTTSPAGPAPGSASDTTVDETMPTSSTSKAHADVMPSSSSAVPLIRDVTVAREATTKSGSNTTAYEPTSTSSARTMHYDTISSRNAGTDFTSAAWETKTKFHLAPTSSVTKTNPVTTALASSTLSISTQESKRAPVGTVTSNTTNAIPPSSATATTRGSVNTTVPKAETSSGASAASSTLKARSTITVASSSSTPVQSTSTATTASTKTMPIKCSRLASSITISKRNTTLFTDALNSALKTRPPQDRAKFSTFKRTIEANVYGKASIRDKLGSVAIETMAYAQQYASAPSVICSVELSSWGTVAELVYCVRKYYVPRPASFQWDPDHPITV